MLVIRLVRTGKKNAPSYRVVLIQKTAPPKSGKFLEILGSYNPRLKEVSLKKERIEYWLSQGVQTSDTVHNLLVNQDIIKADKIKKKFKSKKKELVEEKKEKKEELVQEEAESESAQEDNKEESEASKEESKEEPKEEKEVDKKEKKE